MPSQLFVVVPHDRCIVLQLQVPNMDVEACDELQALIQDQLSLRKGSVVLDLSRAKFLPSLAIGALVNAKRKLDQAESSLAIYGLAPNIRRVLQLSSLDRVIQLVDTIDEVSCP